MADAGRRWRRGEQAAERLLRRCATRSWSGIPVPLGEVDLIALDGTTVVFVEVKTRTHSAYGSPFDAVDAASNDRCAVADITSPSTNSKAVTPGLMWSACGRG